MKKRTYPDKDGYCWICGMSGCTEWHHIVYRSHGGGEGDNLIEVCRACHRLLHEKKITADEARLCREERMMLHEQQQDYYGGRG